MENVSFDGMNVECKYLSGKCVEMIGLIGNMLEIIGIVQKYVGKYLIGKRKWFRVRKGWNIWNGYNLMEREYNKCAGKNRLSCTYSVIGLVNGCDKGRSYTLLCSPFLENCQQVLSLTTAMCPQYMLKSVKTRITTNTRTTTERFSVRHMTTFNSTMLHRRQYIIRI